MDSKCISTLIFYLELVELEGNLKVSPRLLQTKFYEMKIKISLELSFS